MRPNQQDFGISEQWRVKGEEYKLDHITTISKMFKEGHKAMQSFERSGTVAAGLLVTKKKVSLYSCGDCGVALIHPQSPSEDGHPIKISPAKSGVEVIGKDGSRLNVGGYHAIENEDNFPDVVPEARVTTFTKEELAKVAQKHGPSIAVIYSDGAYGPFDENIDFKKLHEAIQPYKHDKEALPEIIREHLIETAQQSYIDQDLEKYIDNQTVFCDYIPELADKLIANTMVCDGHGRHGEKVAQTVAKTASQALKSSIQVHSKDSSIGR